MPIPDPVQPRRNCPKCGLELRRLPRESGDDFNPSLRRYGCTNKACDWEGLLPRMVSRRVAAPIDRTRPPSKYALRRAFFVAMAVVACLVFLALVTERLLTEGATAAFSDSPGKP